MKIISGKHKNRIVPTIKSANYRPSTTKFREALFSIISSGEFMETQPLIDARILDLFCGTGILTFEALSRGALSATLVDINPEYLKHIVKFANKIGEEYSIETLEANACLLSKAKESFDIIFMDPPYHQNLCLKTLNNLIKNHWLAKGAIITMEMERSAKFDVNNFPNFRLIKEKNYGNSKLVVLKYS